MIPVNLQDIERKVFRTFFEDGLLELGIGCVILLSGLSMTMNNGRFIIPLFFIPVLVLITMKRKIVVPRMGVFRAGSKQKRKKWKAFIVLSVSVLLNILIIAGSRKGLFTQLSGNLPFLSILISVKILLVFMLLAFFLGYDRLYYWAGVLATGFVLSEGRIHETGRISDGAVFLMITGGLIFIFGLILFIRFLHYYPLPVEENHGQS